MKSVVTPRKAPILMLVFPLGCGNWPRHAHLPSGESKAISTQESPSTGLEIDWIEAEEAVEPNDSPGDVTRLALSEGIVVTGELLGTGWDPGLQPERLSDCGEPLAFPPDGPGNYTGDVDWITVDSADAATLCAAVTLDNQDISFDLTMYVLDACDQPVEIFIDDDGPIGIERTGGQWDSQVIIPQGTRVGIALSSYWPDDPDLVTPWTISVAMAAPVSGVDICPGQP